jgi:hypothetical protein
MWVAEAAPAMPWLRRSFRLWRVTLMRDGSGGFYLRWDRNPPRLVFSIGAKAR